MNIEQDILDLIITMSKDDSFIYRDYLHLEKKLDFTNICYFEFIVFSIHIKPKTKYLRFPSSFYNCFENHTISKIASAPDFIRVHFDSIQDIEKMQEGILTAIKSISAPPSFDICSRYEKCSNELRCLHPDPRHSLECTYRKKLQDGIVFFGKNRNID